jgi:hypothetical protein
VLLHKFSLKNMKTVKQILSRVRAYLKGGAMYATWYGINNPFGSDAFTTTGGAVAKAQVLINLAINMSGLVAVVIIIYGGYLMIIAAGDSDQISKGEQTVTNGVIGLVIVFVAKLIIEFVISKL